MLSLKYGFESAHESPVHIPKMSQKPLCFYKLHYSACSTYQLFSVSEEAVTKFETLPTHTEVLTPPGTWEHFFMSWRCPKSQRAKLTLSGLNPTFSFFFIQKSILTA
jgi:hypothetical protein